MFTGLIETTGIIKTITPQQTAALLTVETGKDFVAGLRNGDSIAVSGVCLTVTSRDKSTFTALAVEETLRRSTLGDKKTEDIVNLERALTTSTRLGGHVVQGHVDGVGTIENIRSEGEGWWVTIEPKRELLRYVVEKGSITLDGISLTVVNVAYRHFAVVVIPHTRAATTAHNWQRGTSLNIEVDLFAKYVERLMQWHLQEDEKKGGNTTNGIN